MRPRTDILAIFSTFIQFEGDRFDAWVSEPRLARNMQQQLLQNRPLEHSEKDWVLYWYRLREENPDATKHLWAYLQEPCYWAADHVTRRFPMVQCSLADGFQIAIAHVDRILNGYNPDYSSNLRAYARTAFGNCLRDQLRQQQAINISSDWGLLRRLSQTQLKNSLQSAGYIHLDPLILIWKCFKDVCIPEPGRLVRGLQPPNKEQLQAISARYNQLRYNLIPNSNGVDISIDVGTKELLRELTQLAAIARSYLTPSITSLNQPQYDDSGEEQLDALQTHDTPMTELLATEDYKEQQLRAQQIGAILKNEVANLDAPSQTLLTLYYQQALTQNDIANQLDIKQYQVSRKLSRIRQRLLLSVTTWSQETLHIPNEATVLASVSEVIHEWLQRHYSPELPKVLE
ncbi:sigma-70 family RNA polymerase sigma factor [Adonisia turfae]|uniref:Sigma-70 family RNA polymerase sigma factor n=1 Tax=Adonisia turfae CCMR0081 TaxID=2292702 RepID=A0A6M0RFU0_9CYAN|nr:sigma-70 family RNA polymerase sigma factor [Adonisia turfae]NEZ55127.1 sigma-70 family RNA polymerase sigma factor [Adonisia turfae CCMR0081]